MSPLIVNHLSDIIHGSVVVFIVIAATVYAITTRDHSSNVWLVYASGIAFAAGRAGVAAVRTVNSRSTDQRS